MSTVKKRINITVKKAPTPFHFPGSSSAEPSKKIPMIIPKQPDLPEPSNLPGPTASVAPSLLVPPAAPVAAPVVTPVIPVKRGRGRPRKDQKQPATSTGTTENSDTTAPTAPSNGTGTGTDTGTDTSTGTGTGTGTGTVAVPPKKRGRKPRATNGGEAADKVYSLFGGKKTVNVDNFENLSYIVNLKITKSRADKIFRELQRTKIGKGTEAGSNSDGGMMDFPHPSRAAIGSFNNIHKPKALSSIYKMVYPHIDRRKIRVGTMSSLRMTGSGAGTGMNLQGMEQVTIRTQMSSGYADCYVGELMPGFSMGNRWPVRSDYPCRNCGEGFTNTPAGLVRKVEGDFEVDPQNCKFHLYLNFCSWPCALRYAFDRMRDWMDQQFLLNFCYNTVQKIINPSHRWSKIKIAPELDTLRKNGGPLSIQQYREATESNRSYNIYIPPLIPLRMTLEESSRDMTTRTNVSARAGGRKKKFVPMDATRMRKAEMSIRNRKNSVRGTMTIDKLMKMEVRTVN